MKFLRDWEKWSKFFFSTFDHWGGEGSQLRSQCLMWSYQMCQTVQSILPYPNPDPTSGYALYRAVIIIIIIIFFFFFFFFFIIIIIIVLFIYRLPQRQKPIELAEKKRTETKKKQRNE